MKRLKINDYLMVAAIVLILAYIAAQVYSVTHIDLKTQTAEITTIYEKIETKALIVRDEHRIANPEGVVCVPAIADGDKVKADGNVALTFSSAEAAAGYAKYNDIQSELRYYENLQSQAQTHKAGIEALNAEILTDVDEYIRALETGEQKGIDEKGNKINDCLLRRQMTIGEEVDLLSIISELNKQAQEYTSMSTPGGFVKTEDSGVFSSYTDGYEDIIKYDDAEKATVEQLESAIDTVSKEKGKDTNSLGKLVTSYAWYFECVLSADDVKNLKDGQRVNISLKNSDDTVLLGEIISGAEPEDGAEKTALIIKCNILDSRVAALRLEDIEIRVKKYEGFKIPTSALHKNGDKKGVYALISSQVHFREIEVIYSADDYVIAKFEEDNPDGIRLYDQIIIQGKELEDGKVYT